MSIEHELREAAKPINGWANPGRADLMLRAADELSWLRARVAELEKAGYGKPVIRRVERAPLVIEDARDDERCRWPECTCCGPQAPNHCKRQTRRTLDSRALSEREGQE